MGWIERIAWIIIGVAIVATASVYVASSETRPHTQAVATTAPTPATPEPTAVPLPPATPKPTAKPGPVASGHAGAVQTTHVLALHTLPDLKSRSLGFVTPDVLLPVVAQPRGSFYYVITPMEQHAWIHASGVKVIPWATHHATSLKDATIVLDPGHGGSQTGAVGPTRFAEKDANLGITMRVLAQLKDGPRVFVSRGYNTAGLKYRSALANTLHADAFISIHNNSAPRFLQSRAPGTETYYQQRSTNSKRLAGLIYEELTRALKRFPLPWIRTKFAGAKYRPGTGGHDYYSVLRETHVPAVIVEGMYISNRAEEALLKSGPVRQLMADAIARGIKRYFNTKDSGSGFVDPYAKPHQGGHGTLRP